MSSFEYRLNRKREEMRSLFTRLYGNDEALDVLESMQFNVINR